MVVSEFTHRSQLLNAISPFSQGASTALPVGRKKRTGQEDIDLSLSPSGLRLCFLWELPSLPLSLFSYWFLFAFSSSQLAMKQLLPSPVLSCHHIAIFIYNWDMLFAFWIARLGEIIIVCLSWISIITSIAFDFGLYCIKIQFSPHWTHGHFSLF